MDYRDFLKSKKFFAPSCGFDVSAEEIHNSLFPFQRDIVLWALRKGKAAIFAGTGLGKTLMQLEWAKHICRLSGDNVLILAPLAVSRQTVREGEKIGVEVNLCRSQNDIVHGINIANYEILHKFDPASFAGIVLDESSILKSFSGATRNEIISAFRSTPYRLACTATPAPNDHMELGNHSEFLGAMSRSEMLANFFVHDGGDTGKWRLKRHGITRFWEWVASWAVMLQKPSDLGYDDNGFILPPLNIHHVVVDSGLSYIDRLLLENSMDLQARRRARQDTVEQRVDKCAEVIGTSDDSWLVWCGLNKESSELARRIDGAIEVKGSDDNEYKEKSLLAFANGQVKRLVTKPSIAGFGMNLQVCHKVIFVGLSDSFEEFYQAIRRCYRFGQRYPVDVYVITADIEGPVVDNIRRKEDEFNKMLSGMVAATQEITKINLGIGNTKTEDYRQDVAKGNGWTIYLGDCVEVIRTIPDESVHYSIFSPPFASLYTYTDSERDMGNCKDQDHFLEHFRYLVGELYRVIKPGRLVSFHCMDIPAMKERDGYIGLKDFPGDLIRLFEQVGFIYHSRVVIWKDPLIEATRTKALGLMHKQIVKDSAMCRQGLPDYLITMRKPGSNEEAIAHPNGFTDFIGEDEPKISKRNVEYSHHVWRRYASPVWMDINQSNTLQRTSARDEADEKHICPLQLDVIERALELWTNPGDVVLSPFAGIGSEGYVSIQKGRQFIGIELKESYWWQAVANLRVAKRQAGQMTLLDLMEDSAHV